MGSFRHADAVAMRDSHWPFRACMRANIDVWCIGKDANGRPMFAPSQRLFDATKNAMSGTFDATVCK